MSYFEPRKLICPVTTGSLAQDKSNGLVMFSQLTRLSQIIPSYTSQCRAPVRHRSSGLTRRSPRNPLRQSLRLVTCSPIDLDCPMAGPHRDPRPDRAPFPFRVMSNCAIPQNSVGLAISDIDIRSSNCRPNVSVAQPCEARETRDIPDGLVWRAARLSCPQMAVIFRMGPCGLPRRLLAPHQEL